MVMSADHQYTAELARRVAERLSLPRERVEGMLARSDRLRWICDDYEACRAAADRWRSIKATGLSRLAEFEILSDDLEAEVARCIADEMDDSARGTSR
jgi:hypothetical protein